MNREYNISGFLFVGIMLIVLCRIETLAQPLEVSIQFDPNNACSGTQISYSCTVTGGTPPYLYAWNFDDPSSPNNTSVSASPKHTYNPFGCDNAIYLVSVTVTDTTGGQNIQASATKLVTVKRRPNPQLNELLNTPPFSNCFSVPPPTPANPDFIINVNNITPEQSCIVSDSYSIDWGDGTQVLTGLSNEDFPIDHTYTSLGAFNLVFGCMGTNGCPGSTIHVVKNESNPACGVVSPGQTQGCAPITFAFNLGENFINNSPYTIYEWNFGDNTPYITWDQQTAIVSNGVIHHTYTKSSCPYGGDFIVVVNASNSCSNTVATVDGVVVWSTADVFIDTAVGGCVGQPVYLSNWSGNGWGPGCITNTEYTWNFGNGNTFNGFSPPPQIYNQPGVYTITITGENYCGETTFIWPLIIDEPPTANATPSLTNGCVGDSLVVQFTNLSSGDNLEYLWSIVPGTGHEYVGGTDSISKNPEILFTNQGVYEVTLKTYNNCDEDYKTCAIHSNDKPTAEFTIEEIITCDSPFIYEAGQADIIYDDQGDSITSYHWSFPGANPPNSNVAYPQNIIYSSAGNYTVTLIIENDCGPDTVYQSIEIVSQIDPMLSADTSVCHNSPGFQLFADPNIGSWSGDIVNPDGFVSTNITGTYYLTYSGECLIPDSVKVNVYPLPEIEIFTPDTGVCIYHEPVVLSATPPGGTWQGAGITNPETGIFYPSVSGAGFFHAFYFYTDTFPDCTCTNSDNISIIVDSKPIPAFLPADTIFCSGIGYTFTNITSGGNNNSISWEFSDGFTSNSTTQVDHTFADTGFYTIKITALSQFGCSDSVTRSIRVIKPPPDPVFTMNFSPANLCSPADITISFEPQVYDEFVTFQWDFGNGTSLTSNTSFSDTTITYFQGIIDTTYFISLDVINQCGILNFTDSVTVHAPPLAFFGQDYNWNCSPKPVNFINKSMGLVDSIFWNFGDGTDTVLYYPQMDQVLKHSFFTGENDTVYSINMITYNTCGTDTCRDQVVVFPNTLTAFFNTDTTFGCSPLTVHFTNYSSPHTLHYTWAVINGPDTLRYIDKHFTYTFLNDSTIADTILVQLWIDDNCSRDTARTEIIIYPNPDLNFQMSTSEICAGEIVYFENLSDVADLYWDFGDGSSLYPLSNIVSHTYDTSGQFIVSLIGRSVDFGCYDTLSKSVTVKPTPNAFIHTPETAGCAPLTVFFESDSSFIQTWDFGDQSQVSIEPYHTYDNPGLYIVTMVSEYENMCTDTAYLEIRVLPKPVSNFTITSQGGYPEKVQLINESVDDINCEWIMPDGQHLNNCGNADFEFSNIGTYPITLITWNEYGCPDTITRVHEVYFKGLYIPDAFSPDNPADEIREFKAVGIGLKSYYLEVYDTYGNQVWKTNLLLDSKPAEGWNGALNGIPLQQDVYIWKADGMFLDNTIWQGLDDGKGNLKKYGTVTLIR